MLSEDRREKALILLRALVAQSKPPEWQPYDEFEYPVDRANTAEWHKLGYDRGYWRAAATAREALQLLETLDEEIIYPPEDWDEDETTTLGLGA